MKSVILIKDISIRKFYCFFLTALISIILIAGCSKDLSGNKAKVIIINQLKYPIPVTKELDVGSKIMVGPMSPKWLESLKHDDVVE